MNIFLSHKLVAYFTGSSFTHGGEGHTNHDHVEEDDQYHWCDERPYDTVANRQPTESSGAVTLWKETEQDANIRERY